MIGSLAMFACLATGSQAPASQFTTDLFLVAGNERPLTELAWLEKPTSDDPIQTLLRPALLPLAEQKRSFLIIDGGDCSIFPGTPNPQVRYLQRTYSGYVSKSESTTVRGRTTTRDVERTEMTGTQSGGIHCQPLGRFYYTSRINLHFERGTSPNIVVFQDLNSYHMIEKQGMPQDLKDQDKTILISRESITDSKRFLEESKYDFRNVCISARGLKQPDAPNFIAFPPAGVVAHYKLTRSGDRWSASLVEYLRAKTR